MDIFQTQSWIIWVICLEGAASTENIQGYHVSDYYKDVSSDHSNPLISNFSVIGHRFAILLCLCSHP